MFVFLSSRRTHSLVSFAERRALAKSPFSDSLWYMSSKYFLFFS